MKNNCLHIISLDVPFPANYGGVIDIFYKAKALAEAGIQVHLHCFQYGRVFAEQLNFCAQVHYYKRDCSLRKQGGLMPYIVSSRDNRELEDRLLMDNFPILCEGLHTTKILTDPRFAQRKVYVRAHNVEHDYYRLLGEAETSVWKRCYYYVEAARLKRYEAILHKASGIFPLSQKDAAYFLKGYNKVMLFPPFCGAKEVSSSLGRGAYVLYHGNLSVRENKDAAIWLMRNVFSKIEYPCIIAGLNPSSAIQKEAEKYSNVQLQSNLSDEDMRLLIQQAQVNVMVTNQPTGLKLKLLNALSQGRFCVVNGKMLVGTSLQDLCVQADDAATMIAEIERLMQIEFSAADRAYRAQIFSQNYDDASNAKLLIETIFS